MESSNAEVCCSKKFVNSGKKNKKTHALLLQIRAVLTIPVCKQQTSERVHQCISSTTLAYPLQKHFSKLAAAALSTSVTSLIAVRIKFHLYCLKMLQHT